MECPCCEAKNRDWTKFCGLCAQRIDGEETEPSAAYAGENEPAKTAVAWPKIAGLAVTLLLLIGAAGALLFNQGKAGSASAESKSDKAPLNLLPTAPAPIQTNSSSVMRDPSEDGG